MIRRYCIKTLAAAMLCAGVIGGQIHAATPTGKTKSPANENINPDKIITLQGNGEKERRCVIIKTDTRPDGTIAHQVKDLENGEVMTILEPKAPSNSKTSTNDLKPLPTTIPPVTEFKPVNTSKSQSNSPYRPVEKPNKMPDLEPIRIPTVDPVPSVKNSSPPIDPIPSAQNPPLSKTIKELPPIPNATPSSKPESVKVLPETTIKPELTEIKGTPVRSSTIIVPPEQPKQGLLKRIFSSSSKTTVLPPKKVMTPPPATLTPIPKENLTPTSNNAPKVMPSGSAPIISLQAIPPVQLPVTATVQGDPLKEGLRDALQPSHREIAAEQLVAGPQGRSMDVRKALLVAVKEDPAPTVRSTCLRCLAKQGINDDIFQAAMKCAQEDKDSNVRDEAKLILTSMSK